MPPRRPHPENPPHHPPPHRSPETTPTSVHPAPRPGWVRLLFPCILLLAGSSHRLVNAANPAQPAPPPRQTPLPHVDFTGGRATGWKPLHDLDLLFAAADGVLFRIVGKDPYFAGPPADYPEGTPLWMNLRIRSDAGGGAQVFFYTNSPSEAASVRFHVPQGDWTVVRVPLPSLGPGTRLRLDPPGTSGLVAVAQLSFEPRPVLPKPDWSPPGPPARTWGGATLQNGRLTLTHHRRGPDDFELRVDGFPMARGHPAILAGYAAAGAVRWVVLTGVSRFETSGNEWRIEGTSTDPDGGEWRWQRRVSRSASGTGFDIASELSVDRDRSIVCAPLLLLFPGIDSFGERKAQALLAGVEYLEDEPSSSEADVIGPASHRQVPDHAKLTAPLTAITDGHRWMSLSWEPAAHLAILHDSPDRIFKSGGHAWGLVAPGSDPSNREDGALLPYEGLHLRPGAILAAHATLAAGLGSTVVPAIQDYIARTGLPPTPPPRFTREQYYDLTARAWLDSGIRAGPEFRHAIGPGFNPRPAADAGAMIGWLAGVVADRDLARRLSKAAEEAWTRASLPHRAFDGIGHLPTPAPALITGPPDTSAATAGERARHLIATFDPSGHIAYTPRESLDLARTHGSREANGHTATAVREALELAAFSGDPATLASALGLLEGLHRFRKGVPRGAQSWEVPLHTPDILASAELVRCHVLGFELTGDTSHLEAARYWAWTGVPFVRLMPWPPPVDPLQQGKASPHPHPGSRQQADPRRCDLYATIPVLGATHWVAPVWIGLPVQWCGLVYGHALRRLARHDPGGPWPRLADGIALSALQQLHRPEEGDLAGLLPDSVDIRAQARNPVPINPATLQVEAMRTFGEPPMADFRWSVRHRLGIHAPGAIEAFTELPDGLTFRVTPWMDGPWWLWLTGINPHWQVEVDGRPPDRAGPRDAGTPGTETSGTRSLQLRGRPPIRLRWVP